ncbi:putative secreted protein (Por secretion system target) [Dyadobacter jejuensis]|uniref:Putative secreted protein (Por secretion system target) n=1 Tax=Dyadobacter jejuensis TaxID=1082580 RepID=A0A316AC46_9BACT|nr:sialate O-acetylesterase [Dyadobacter jejuensis]PWJ54989.1 putative secreted protein (Por secretion system target) [Dyadobacter jejuensis]
MKYRILYIFLGLVANGWASKHSFGQIVLTSPIPQQVVQRNLGDSATCAISGYALYPYQRISLSLAPLSPAGRRTVQITVPQEQLTQGLIRTTLKQQSGWYRLIAIGTRPDGTEDTTTVERVGIGEVFLIAGNSNAMGVQDLGAKSASDNVISFDSVNKHLDAYNITVAKDQPMHAPKFSPLHSDHYAYPAGETSWLWGELGDHIYQRYGTPVLFVNAGWAAANSMNYKEAASGQDTYNHYVGRNWPYRQPYTNIVNSLRYFHSWLGIRAVLWSHGENDAYDLGIDQNSYFDNIKFLIDQSRTDYPQPIPWVIGQSTVTFNENEPYPPVISAQKALGTLVGFNTWPGPNSDTIQVPRPGHGHFENVPNGVQGLTLAAQAWNRSLSDRFFSDMAPFQPQAYLYGGLVPSQTYPGALFAMPFSITIDSLNQLPIVAELLSAQGAFVGYVGEDATSPITIGLPKTLGPGSYRIRLVTKDQRLIGGTSAPFDVVTNGSSNLLTRGLKTNKKTNGTEISWLLSADPGLDKVILRKSVDRIHYSDLHIFGAIENRNNSFVYSYIDTETTHQTVYYEIVYQYQDGSYASGGQVVAFGTPGTDQYTAFPNPVVDQHFYIRPRQEGNQPLFQLYDLQGRVHPIHIDTNAIIGLIKIRPLHPLSTGKYILQIADKHGKSHQSIVFY